MNYKLPIITMVLVVTARLPLASAEQEVEKEVTPNGNDLIAKSAENLDQQRSIVAKIRQQASLFGKDLIGTGGYRQLKTGGKTLTRLDLHLQQQDRKEVTSIQQINDGATLWIQRDMNGESVTGYVNLGKLRGANQGRGGTSPLLGTAQETVLGGLQQLMSNLHRSLDFGPPTTSEISSVPVWVLSGHWKPEMLVLFYPDQKEAILEGHLPSTTSLPDHVPDVVTVVLGRDQFIPLFPYRIEYNRQISPRKGSNVSPNPSNLQKLVSMELFEVQHDVPQDPSLFIYDLRDRKIEDWTASFLR